MALWMLRAGRHGEYEDHFLTSSRIFLTWGDTFFGDARQLNARGDVAQALRDRWPNASEGKARNHAGQIWAFLHGMKADDLVVVPSKKKPELHFGVIQSDAQYDESADPNYRHFREVKWLRENDGKSGRHSRRIARRFESHRNGEDPCPSPSAAHRAATSLRGN